MEARPQLQQATTPTQLSVRRRKIVSSRSFLIAEFFFYYYFYLFIFFSFHFHSKLDTFLVPTIIRVYIYIFYSFFFNFCLFGVDEYIRLWYSFVSRVVSNLFLFLIITNFRSTITRFLDRHTQRNRR